MLLKARIKILTHAKSEITALLGEDAEKILSTAAATARAQEASQDLRTCQDSTHPDLHFGSVCVSNLKPGRLLVVDNVDNCIKVFSGQGPHGTLIDVLCTGMLLAPGSMTADHEGNIYVIDRDHAQKYFVRVFDQHGDHVRDFGKGSLSDAQGIAVDAEGQVYIACCQANGVKIFDKHGLYMTVIAGWTQDVYMHAKLNCPQQVALSHDGNLFVTNCDGRSNTQSVVVLNKNGSFVRMISHSPSHGSLHGIQGLAVSASGHLYVSSSALKQILVYCPKGNHVNSMQAEHAGPLFMDTAAGQLYMSNVSERKITIFRNQH
jgi:DNA-binding beta-propeller fold protein YncE